MKAQVPDVIVPTVPTAGAILGQEPRLPARPLKSRLMYRGNPWRILILSTLGFLTFVPFIITLIISFKSIPQFDHQPFLSTLPLQIANYATAFRATARSHLNHRAMNR